MDNIAFLGTGLIGHAFVEAAVGKGHVVSAWNRSPERTADLPALGVRVGASPQDTVRGATRIHLAMTDDVGVDAVLDQITPDGGAIVIDHTTTAVAATAARAARMDARGIAFLHAPVFMSPQACRIGAGMMMVAGPAARYAQVAEALATMTGKVWFVGERPDAAAVYKLLGNSMLLTICGGVADLFALAHQGGLDAADAIQLFDHFDPAGMIKARGTKMARGDFAPSFHLSTARKDLRLMMELADDAPLAVLPAVGVRMDAVLADGEGEADYGIIGAPKYTGRG